MKSHSPLAITFFAKNYLAQIILAVFVAFALQQAIEAIFSCNRFRSQDVKLALRYALEQEYQKYPINNDKKARPDEIKIAPLGETILSGNKIYDSPEEAIESLSAISIRPVIALNDKQLSMWSYHQIVSFALQLYATIKGAASTDDDDRNTALVLFDDNQSVKLERSTGKSVTLKLVKVDHLNTTGSNADSAMRNVANHGIQPEESVSNNKEKNLLQRDIIRFVTDFNQFFQPKQQEIQLKLKKLLNWQRSLRRIAGSFLLVFLIIQPWHLYTELQRFSSVSSRLSSIWVFLLIFTFVGIIITYGAMNWGKGFARTPVYGIAFFMLFWSAFDFVNLYKNPATAGYKKRNVHWLILDIIFLCFSICLIIFFVKIDSYELLEIFRYLEILFLVLLAVFNFVMLFSIRDESNDKYISRFDNFGMLSQEDDDKCNDKYISSLENFGMLSEEDDIDAKIVVAEIERLTKIRGKLSWLDIGSGNLFKIQLVLKSFANFMDHFQLIDCLEPIYQWKRYQTIDLRYPIKVYAQKWPDFVKNTSSDRSWSLITLIHSLYQSPKTQDGLVEDMSLLVDHISSPGSIIIVIEGSDSSLLKAKRKVYGELKGTLITEADIMLTAERLKWPPPYRIEIPQKFFVDIKSISQFDNKNSIFPYFIFESATSKSSAVPLSVVRTACKSLICNIKEATNRTYLDVQDVALIYRFYEE